MYTKFIKRIPKVLQSIFLKVLEFSISHAALVVVVISLATVFLATLLPRIQFNTSISAIFPKSHQSYRFYQTWQKQFGYEDAVIIAFQEDNVFTPFNLMFINLLTNDLANIDHVKKVTSLTNINDAYSIDEDIVIAPLFNNIPTSDA